MLWLLVGIALLAGAVGGANRAVKLRPDWSSFAAEAQYVWEHGRNAAGTAMFGYLPVLPIYLWPLGAWLPANVGGVIFVAINVACVIATLRLAGRGWLRDDERDDVLLWSALLLAVNFAHAVQSNQMTLIVLALCVAGAVQIGRGRDVGGGALLGLAAVVKLLPLALVAPLVLRGRWRAAGGLCAAFLIGAIAPALLTFGPAGFAEEHKAWLQRVGWHSNAANIEHPTRRVYRRANQAYSMVLARWLREPPAAKTAVVLKGAAPESEITTARAALGPDEMLLLDPMPPHDQPWELSRESIAWVPKFHVAAWTVRPVKLLWGGTMAVGAIVLLWTTWRSRRAPEAWAPIAALWLLAMMWPSPMLRHYGLAWAFPAVLIVVRQLRRELRARDGRWTWGMRLGSMAVWAWIVGLPCLGVYIARWYGVHLAILAVVGAACLWAHASAVRRNAPRAS